MTCIIHLFWYEEGMMQFEMNVPLSSCAACGIKSHLLCELCQFHITVTWCVRFVQSARGRCKVIFKGVEYNKLYFWTASLKGLLDGYCAHFTVIQVMVEGLTLLATCPYIPRAWWMCSCSCKSAQSSWADWQYFSCSLHAVMASLREKCLPVLAS